MQMHIMIHIHVCGTSNQMQSDKHESSYGLDVPTRRYVMRIKMKRRWDDWYKYFVFITAPSFQ